MIAGPSVEEHHLIRRSCGGRDTVVLHRICHRKIHAELTARDLKDRYHTIEALKAHPAIAAFLCWVARKPPEFTAATVRRKDRTS